MRIPQFKAIEEEKVNKCLWGQKHNERSKWWVTDKSYGEGENKHSSQEDTNLETKEIFQE